MTVYLVSSLTGTFISFPCTSFFLTLIVLRASLAWFVKVKGWIQGPWCHACVALKMKADYKGLVFWMKFVIRSTTNSATVGRYIAGQRAMSGRHGT
jgi:hypothetical protein